MNELKLPTPGRIVHFFPNKADDISSKNNAELVPAIVIQAFSTKLNLQVFTMNGDALNVLRYSVGHKSDYALEDGSVQEGISYWDWPTIN